MLTYQMTVEESHAWSVVAEPFRSAVEEHIAEVIQDAGCLEDVLVTLDSGAIAYMIEQGRG